MKTKRVCTINFELLAEKIVDYYIIGEKFASKIRKNYKEDYIKINDYLDIKTLDIKNRSYCFFDDFIGEFEEYNWFDFYVEIYEKDKCVVYITFSYESIDNEIHHIEYYFKNEYKNECAKIINEYIENFDFSWSENIQLD